MYFRWKPIPELADLPPEQRKAIWREARRDPFRASDLLWLLYVPLGSAIVFFVVESLPKSLPIWIGLPVWIAAFVAWGQLITAMTIHRYRPVVKRLRAQ